MLLHRVGRRLAAMLVHVSFTEALGIAAAYVLISYVGLRALGEDSLTAQLSDFIYWLVVTTSTVGYGDLSPQTPAGKLFVVVVIIPLGLALFAMFLTRTGVAVSELVRRHHRGLSMINESNHIVIIGWTPGRTNRLVELLRSSANGLQEQIVLISEEQHENPLPDKLHFVKVDSFLNSAEMQRGGIEHASRVVIDLDSDDATLTTALLCQKLNPTAHKTAYFQSESVAALLRDHCPQVEIIPSISIELLARSTLDPGSAAIHQRLLDSTIDTNQFSRTYGGANTEFAGLFTHYKTQFNATIVAVKQRENQTLLLNPPTNLCVHPGDTLYYYATTRVDGIRDFVEQAVEH